MLRSPRLLGQESRGDHALTTHFWRRNNAQMTHFGRAINKICLTAAQGHIDPETRKGGDAGTLRTESVEATPLVKLLRPYAKGLQTLCRE